ncbi:RNA 2',3'-cyclic phosphodiesterase [Ignicoccus hospitalis]|uniref:RNA 2',3'-cyclic phosphodiesterase n=1 Tax=Ignicoccus hospitalis (strain KIN4/I / DSM 18386 / JCM 14125) TaxID=453591 RepID=A8AAT0_IGNH4|nr:RNA 2',3'-cyclic phosphodiesterase [Ignicoccus hospitalis]ABU82032.1 2'-5' RNA ligase [Ignicoccus hospitalis KIN4/I]HIH90989.1 RNA 2',3'-cyclic phosphodiesterase [Desulfurococcaceae archaeon]
MLRAFIAVDIEGELSEKLARLAESLKSTGADVKLVEKENFHITIRFLGNVPEESIDVIEKIMRDAVREVKPHKLKLRGVGAFPSPERPRVVWVGVEGDEELRKIFERIERELRRLGFKPETKGFTAHVTLARVRSGRGREALVKWINDMKDVELGELEVKSIRLKKSTLTPRGPIYETLREVELA